MWCGALRPLDLIPRRNELISTLLVSLIIFCFFFFFFPFPFQHYFMSLRRALHTTARRASHIGSLPISVPAGVRLGLPALSISPELPPGSPAAQRLLTVTGPLGEQILPLSPPIILDSSPDAVRVSVHDSTEKRQRSLWGLTRSLINNAVKGVSEGYTLELRLVGVGYRGAVEPIPEVFIELQRQMPRTVRTSKPGAPPYHPPPLPTDRINLKLGYAHPVLIDIPAGITVTTPSPTTIILKGSDKQKLGLFAAKIRRWRKPEPYRGKVGGPRESGLTAGYLCRGRDHPAQRDQEEVMAGMHLSYRLRQAQASRGDLPTPARSPGRPLVVRCGHSRGCLATTLRCRPRCQSSALSRRVRYRYIRRTDGQKQRARRFERIELGEFYR